MPNYYMPTAAEYQRSPASFMYLSPQEKRDLMYLPQEQAGWGAPVSWNEYDQMRASAGFAPRSQLMSGAFTPQYFPAGRATPATPAMPATPASGMGGNFVWPAGQSPVGNPAYQASAQPATQPSGSLLSQGPYETRTTPTGGGRSSGYSASTGSGFASTAAPATTGASKWYSPFGSNRTQAGTMNKNYWR